MVAALSSVRYSEAADTVLPVVRRREEVRVVVGPSCPAPPCAPCPAPGGSAAAAPRQLHCSSSWQLPCMPPLILLGAGQEEEEVPRPRLHVEAPQGGW